MDIRHMRYFLAVAEELSFRRAADRLHISQPPLSTQIQSMENEIGAPLFDRSRQKIRLTAAGEFLLPHVRAAVLSFDQTVALAKRASKGEAGRLRIGFTGSVTLRKGFPRILRRFRDSFPNVLLEVFHSSTDAQVQMLGSGAIDLGFIRVPASRSTSQLRLDKLWHDTLELFAAADSKFARSRRPLAVENLVEENFVGFSALADSGSSERVTKLCREAGFTPRIVQRARDAPAILGFVAAGMGIAILPNIYAKSGVSGIVTRTIKAANCDSDLVLASRESESSSLVKQFRRIAVEEANA